MNLFQKSYLLLFFCVSLLSPFAHLAYAETVEVRNIFFPTDHNTTFIDSFGDPRYGHAHEGIDIMGEKMTPLYAAVDGYISYIVIPEKSWGYSLTLRDSDGYTYHYLHMNNDTPGTDDGRGGVDNAYAEGVHRGARVTRGQLVGWMGDSGNAESVGPHLHFEIRKNGTAINPYQSLVKAIYPGTYSIEEALYTSPNISIDKKLSTSTKEAACAPDTLIKLEDMDTVYYCGADGKRYYFPSDKIYFTWYDDFDDVVAVSAETMASIPLGGNVTYRPGTRMVKLQTDPKVYAVERGDVLRWIQSAETAEELYGADWNKQIDDIPDSFFVNYTLGDPILSVRPVST